MAARPFVLIIGPASANANNGNWHTAQRWQAHLEPFFRVEVRQTWTAADPAPDLLIALHARKSAASIHAYSQALPHHPVVVVLTGTDLYRDVAIDADAQRSLELATRLVLLQAAGYEALPPGLHAKTRVIHQSAPAVACSGERALSEFTVCSIGHLREEKRPDVFMDAARLSGQTSNQTSSQASGQAAPPIRWLQVGNALSPDWEAKAKSTAQTCPHYLWRGGLTHADARQTLACSDLMAITSEMEGGANVIIEALTSNVPVIASDVSGNRGMLGEDYEGYVPLGDAKALADAVRRVRDDVVWRQRLQQQCAVRAPLFAPEHEAAALRALVDNCLSVPDPSGRLSSTAVTAQPIAPMTPSPSTSPSAVAAAAAEPLRLTSFSHGGGCGCKIAPGVLSEILKSSQASKSLPLPKELLVGIETADDAAVYRLNDEQALIATTDFFMPIVDDPRDFGRIAATNAISDVYAMGGTPIMALALVGMPIDKLPISVISEILRGGESICAEAGIPIAGGHTIDSVEPIYGLVVLGLVHPDRIKRNAGARAGDVLVLGKPLGVGVLSAALKKGQLDDAGYRAMIASTTKLNLPGRTLSALAGVHALTDITGFGLLGHGLELARGSGLRARIHLDQVPLLPEVRAMAEAGCITGASARNWAGYGNEIRLGTNVDAVSQALLTDPQTSGGLLVSCSPETVPQVLELFRADGFDHAAVVGEMVAGEVGVEVD